MNPTVEQTDILGDEQMAEIEQRRIRGYLNVNQRDVNVAMERVRVDVDALLRHAAALQAQLDAAQAEVARVRDWKNNLFDYLDRDEQLPAKEEGVDERIPKTTDTERR